MDFIPDPQLSEFTFHLEGFEGRFPFPYLDGAGNVSTGVGHLCSSLEEFVKLGWVGGKPENDFLTVKSSRPKMGINYYAGLTTCRLPQDIIDELRNADIAGKISQLTAALPECTGWPVAARAALLDMSFNIGVHGIVSKYPNMLAAIRSGDWKTAATESHRNGIQDARNQYTAGLFLSCASPVV